MDGYPAGSLDHNVPLLVAAGLNTDTNELPLDAELRDQGILLRSELPSLEGKEAKVLGEYLREIDVHGRSWSPVEREDPHRFRVKTLGRSFLLPPRRARLPENTEPLDGTPVLHSPFSPLSPVSALYPDGLLNAQWVKKHQELIPSIYLCFYSLTGDPTSTTLHDNQIKTDVNNLRSALARSGYKTRLAIVLIGEDGGTPASLSEGIQERLENIRRGTALDPKSVFYIPPQESPAELKGVIDSILGVLYTTAVEYYRDLGRHARKKRSRGYAPQPSIPPTTGTSQTLELPGWNFRYDFKSAVFAEFRQEIDAALRSFEQAYEVLLGQDVLDIIPSWSPRWNEARLLSDILGIRIMRCHIWLQQPTLAVRRWQLHRDRIGDFVDRRGRGTNNYGWQAWEARWAMVMADLIEKIDVPGLAPSTMTLFLQPEKAVLGERLAPWEHMHHTGYWYRIAARHLVARRQLALQIPEDDRMPPDELAATPIASKAYYTYDTYMCPEPYQEYPMAGKGVNHAQLIINCLQIASTQFQVRKQLRSATELSLECAREMVKLEQWRDAVETLQSAWDDASFRSEGWSDITEDLCWTMRRAASGAGRADLVVAADWELMNSRFHRRPQWHYDITKSLEGVSVSEKPSISLSNANSGSFVSASLAFRHKESKAGEVCIAQLALTSHTFLDAAPMVLDSVKVAFTGSIKPIELKHVPGAENEKTNPGAVSISTLSLTETFSDDSDADATTPLKGEADLTLKPGSTRVYEMKIPLREPGQASAASVELLHGNDAFDLSYAINFGESDPVVGWYVQGSSKPRQARLGATTIQIQPRPPKIEIRTAEPLTQCYANEPIRLKIELLNAEDEAANVKLDVHLFGRTVPAIQAEANGHKGEAEAADEECSISGLALGTIERSESMMVTINIGPAALPSTYDLHLRASYHLASDAATPIMQILPLQLAVVNAFEANYDLVPRLHADPWPSLFDPEGLLATEDNDGAVVPRGFAQRWSLLCHYASFAQEDLKVVGMDLAVLSCTGGARCNVVKTPAVPRGGVNVEPKSMHEAQFDLVAQKLTMEDRQPVTPDLAFVIRWRRQSNDDSVVNTTTMPVGKYLVLGSEPRVLASARHSEREEWPGLVQLDVTVENPSNHFLTFGLTMEPSDQFAFSGAKQTTLNLLPQSRRTTTYRLLPLVRGDWVRPGLTVRDKYFQKVLRIIPTEGMKIDKDGLLVWVPGA